MKAKVVIPREQANRDVDEAVSYYLSEASELNRIELLRDVFVWAYERSCQQYVAVKSQLVPPDTFRLRYRVALAEAVCAVVRRGLPATMEAVRFGLRPLDFEAWKQQIRNA